jgi:hypothetical protein
MSSRNVATHVQKKQYRMPADAIGSKSNAASLSNWAAIISMKISIYRPILKQSGGNSL